MRSKNSNAWNARLIFMDTGRLLINIIKFLLYREHLKHPITQLQLTTDGCCRGPITPTTPYLAGKLLRGYDWEDIFTFIFTHSGLLITYRNSDGARTPASVAHSVKLTSSHRVSGLSGLCNATPKVGGNSYLVWPAGTSGRLTVSRQNLSSFSFKEATSACHGQRWDWTFVAKLKSDKVKSLHFSQPKEGEPLRMRDDKAFHSPSVETLQCRF